MNPRPRLIPRGLSRVIPLIGQGMHRALQGHEGGVIDRLGNARSHWQSLCIGLGLGAESKECGEWANCDGPYKDPWRAKQSAEHSVNSLPSRSSYCLIIRRVNTTARMLRYN